MIDKMDSSVSHESVCTGAAFSDSTTMREMTNESLRHRRRFEADELLCRRGRVKREGGRPINAMAAAMTASPFANADGVGGPRGQLAAKLSEEKDTTSVAGLRFLPAGKLSPRRCFLLVERWVNEFDLCFDFILSLTCLHDRTSGVSYPFIK